MIIQHSLYVVDGIACHIFGMGYILGVSHRSQNSTGIHVPPLTLPTLWMMNAIKKSGASGRCQGGGSWHALVGTICHW